MYQIDKLFILRRDGWYVQHFTITTINTIDCMYSKLPPEDEYFIYSKHVEDIIGINLKRKCNSLVLITQIYHDERSI